MRILFWSDLFWPYIGGGEIFGTRLLRSLRDRYEFIVVTSLQDDPALPSEDSYCGVPIYRFPFCTAIMRRDTGKIMALRKQVAELKKTFAANLIHLHNFGPSIFFHAETSTSQPAPVLFTVQLELSPYKSDGVGTLLGETLRCADWVTAVSSATMDQIHRRAPETVSRSSLILNSIEIPSLSPEPLPVNPPKLLCLGRLEVQKGFDLALSAFGEVIKTFPLARLIIAGDGPERLALERQAADLNLTANVDFTGWVSPDNITDLINATTVTIVPSRWEGLPLVALEAASMARPVIATRISGLSELILHRQTGLLIPREDSKRLAQAIVYLLTQPKLASQMGKAARRRVQELFGWEQCVEAYDALYQKLASKHPHAGRGLF